MAGKDKYAEKTPKDGEENKGIVLDTNIVTEMKESYIAYAMSVIVSRALPDVRDGLKPVHRRILYAMHEMGLTAGSRPRKSAAVVGDVLGKYHPHGDSSVYDAMVNMAQTFSYRYPLVIGQGNFGSIDGDNAAAMRYTEAKMAKISSELLRDLEKETVLMRPNYDGTRQEPSVLPTQVPSLLLNGTLGIAVGMATNIPPHNLTEVIDATNHLLENPDAITEDLLEFVQGPDFPLGGVVYGAKDIAHAYTTGRGGVICRGEAEIVENKSGAYQIIITSLPFRVNKSTLIETIAELVSEKKLEGIKSLEDLSTTDIRVVLTLKNGAQPQRILNYIYKHTQLESTFHYNCVALVDGVPQTLSLKSILSEFISHRQIIIRKRSEYDLKRAKEREHILLGLKKALDHIDKVISTIRASKDATIAKLNLIKEFKFSELQAVAILEMRLQKLAGLERKAVENELKEKQDFIKEMEELLASPKKIKKVISDELSKIKEQFGDERRTRVVKGGLKSMSDEDLIPDKESLLVFSSGGYVKRTDPSEYRMQKRGGVGVIDLETKEEDFVNMLVSASSHTDLLFFTDLGKAYQIKMYELPEGRRATKGKSIMNYLSLSENENVTSIIPMSKDIKAKDVSLMLMTESGVAKKVKADGFKDVRRSGLIAIKLAKGDKLLSANFVEKGDEVILGTKEGQAIRFKESDIREMGRTASGVKAMRLSKADVIIGTGVIKKEEKDVFFLTMSENGLGKKSKISEYKVQKRAGSGIKTAKVTSKTGKLVVAQVVRQEGGIIAISKNGQVIKVEQSAIPVLGRQTQGVTIMKLRAGDGIASLAIM